MARYAKSVSATRAARAAERQNSHSSDPLFNAYAWWLDQAGEFGNEAFRFVNRRLSKDLEAAAELMKCDDSNQALAVQARFANDLAADYLDEGKKWVELIAQAASPQRGSSRSESH